jgi:hypothetical protein
MRFVAKLITNRVPSSSAYTDWLRLECGCDAELAVYGTGVYRRNSEC